MKFRRLHLLPVFSVTLIITTFFSTFIVAVLLDHVKPDFPFISDTASLPPESCVFSQTINIASLMMLLCVYVRYLQLEEELRRAALAQRLPRWCNRTAGLLGATSTVGFNVAANFQVSSALHVHLAGAFVCFSCGILYFGVQTFISRKLLPEVSTTCTFYARAIITVLSALVGVTIFFTAVVAVSLFRGGEIIKWRPEHGGWEPRLASAICEWVLALLFCSFFLTFYGEFRRLVINGPTVEIQNSETMESVKQPQRA